MVINEVMAARFSTDLPKFLIRGAYWRYYSLSSCFIPSMVRRHGESTTQFQIKRLESSDIEYLLGNIGQKSTMDVQTGRCNY